MFQKDLGIKPTPSTPTKEAASQSSPSVQATPSKASATPSKASVSQAAPSAEKATTAGKTPNPPKQDPQHTQTISTTKAYLKHANPSQGMTDVLIQQALSQFGDVTNVTIDSRKGTAIAVFKDGQGLQKARDAKKVSVANGTVEIHEFKDRTAPSGGGRTSFKGNRGGARGGKGGAQASQAASAANAGKVAA
jgi:regulator of nonsense transcripts 3